MAAPVTDADGRPVVVVGAGPVGMTTALLLARWGVRSVLVETEPVRAAVGSKAICIQRDVLDVLARVGVADAMADRGVTWRTGRTYFRDVEISRFTLPEQGPSPYPAFINIAQSETEALLEAAVGGEALVDLRVASTLEGLDARGDGVGVDVRSSDGRLDRIEASWLIGCDGVRSAVRSHAGWTFEGSSYDDRFLIADIRCDLPFELERRFFFDPEWNPGRQVLVHPQPDGVWRIDWQVPGDHDLEAERRSGALDQRISRITGDRPYEVVWLSSYRFQQRLSSRFGQGRVAVAGDAAHVFSPFGARGLNSGIFDAENLAWKIAFVLHRWAPESLVASYEVERRAAARENLAVTDRTMRFLVPRDDGQRWRRRDVLERAAFDPSAAPAVDSGKLAEPYWYTESPLTTPAPSVEPFPTEALVVRPPVPGVLCPDGPIEHDRSPGGADRLRLLFGRSIVLLVAGTGDDTERATEVARGAVAAPVTGYGLADLDPSGELARILRAEPGSLRVVRPDGYLAAALDGLDPEPLTHAVRRSCGVETAS